VSNESDEKDICDDINEEEGVKEKEEDYK